MAVPLLKTKLYIPPARPRERVVSRPRLLERLDQGIRSGCKLILISAPAGFGKTTLASEWVHQADAPTAWLSLDESDNDPTRFWSYVVAALQTVCPGIGETVLSILHAPRPQPPTVEALLADLINEIAAAHAAPLALVLDDLHAITSPQVNEGMVFLLDHLPPQMHLILATRADPPWPLARLRARGEMLELRTRDLRFTLEEATAFLNKAMGLALSAEDIATLDSRAEGWIAGLQMVALSMQGRADTAGFIRGFSGSHRHILDYLMEEVLDQQTRDVQEFLLRTSILERMTAPLCDAILGEADRGPSDWDSQSILAELDRANLFLISLDQERRWYRYHHLFADLLRRRLQETVPEQVNESHARASTWYEGQGSISEAISHALAAGDQERAVYLVERYSGQAARRGEVWQQRSWIEALPEELVRSRPLLCMRRAWALADDPDATQRAEWWMERAIELSASNPRPLVDPDSAYDTDHELIRDFARVFRVGTIAKRQSDPEELVDLCLEVLETLPEETQSERATFARGLVTFRLAQAYRRLHDRDAAERALEQARQLGLAAEGYLIALVVAEEQTREAWERGDLHAVAKICGETIASLIQPAERAGERVPGACHAYVGLGRTLLEWNELGQAEPLLTRGIELAEQFAEPGVRIDGCCDLARLHWIQRDYQGAHAWMDKALQACRWDPAYLHALQARIWLAQAEDDPRWLNRAIAWADGRALEDPGDYSLELQSLVRVRLAQYRACGEPDLAPVLAVLDEHLGLSLPSSGWEVEVLALKALLLQALGRRSEAMVPLARALALGKATGRVLSFLEHGPPLVDLLREAVRRDVEAGYARQLLSAFESRGRAAKRRVPQEKPSAQATLVEPLSARETEVLWLLRTSLSMPEIARELYVSANTIRSHAKHIYAKLDVHSRSEAVERAEELGLL
jgi:LuxR family maltose regulon positive regulatory protein